MTMAKGRPAIGVDLGGTNIKAGVVDEDGRVVSRAFMATNVRQGADAIIGNIAKAADQARRRAKLSWTDVQAVGLGAPGVFEGPEGLMRLSPNIQVLDGAPVARRVAEALGPVGVPVVIENDANAAAYAEVWVGAGRTHKTRSLVLLTLGTGVGGGIVLDGELWRGAWGTAAELGHMNLFPGGALCGCGNRGCIEAYCSVTGLLRRFQEALDAGEKSPWVAKHVRRRAVTGRDISDAARAGDRLCRRLINETGHWLGIAVMNILHMLNVEMIVFAGGMTAAGDLLLRPIRREAKRRTMPLPMRGVKILFSKLGNDAGLIGAAGWALRQIARSGS
jgi:glucokinase